MYVGQATILILFLHDRLALIGRFCCLRDLCGVWPDDCARPSTVAGELLQVLIVLLTASLAPASSYLVGM